MLKMTNDDRAWCASIHVDVRDVLDEYEPDDTQDEDDIDTPNSVHITNMAELADLIHHRHDGSMEISRRERIAPATGIFMALMMIVVTIAGMGLLIECAVLTRGR